jgi:hypothetical protein
MPLSRANFHERSIIPVGLEINFMIQQFCDGRKEFSDVVSVFVLRTRNQGVSKRALQL